MLLWIICYLFIFISFMILLFVLFFYNFWVVKKSMDSNFCKFVYKSIIYLFIFWEGGVIKVFCGSRVWSLCFWRVCRICYCLFFSILFCFVFLCGRVGFGGSCGCGFCSFGWGWISNICDCRFLIGVGK